jgi:hypothetical protein
MTNMGKQAKWIHLGPEIIRILSKMAIDSPQKNFKNYVEAVLIDIALSNELKNLQK